MAVTQDHEQVSQYPLDATQLEQLLTNASECVLMWATKDGWPVGVIHSMLWKDGRFWLTVAAHRHRSAALRRDPRCSVSVSGTAAPAGSAPAGSATAKGRCVIHEDQETKDWFYPEFAAKMSPDPAAAKAFQALLDSPLRLVLEIVPEKWITFDLAKMGRDAAGVLTDEERGPLLSSDAERMPREMKARGLE